VSTPSAAHCEPEKVTAFVDGALAAAEAAAVERHLDECESCRTLADSERAVRRRLQSLPPLELPPGLETRLRSRLDAPQRSWGGRVSWLALPAAAAILFALWARGLAPVVAWELSRDHAHCFGRASLPAQVRSTDPAVVVAWFSDQGTAVPVVPDGLAGARLFGARYCHLTDFSRVPHVYYTGGARPLSLFVLARNGSFEEGYTTRTGGRSVGLLHLEGRAVGVVGESREDVDSALRRLRSDPGLRQALLR